MPDRSAIFVGFCGSNGILGRIIRWATGGDVNHAYLLMWSEEFRGWVQLGAEAGGWVQESAEKLRGNAVVRNGLALMRERLGDGYDVGGLVGMAWVMFLRRVFGKRVGNPFQAKSKLFCSEAVDLVLHDSGIDLGVDAGAIDPAEEERAVRRHGGFSGPFALEEVLRVRAA